MTTRLAILSVALIAAALVMGTGSSAMAHDGLVASSPAAGSTVTTELKSVDLTFSEELLSLGGSTGAFAVQLKGPDGTYHNRGCVQLNGTDASTEVALGESGTYTVLWQVVSSDGHTTSDTFTFTFDQPEGVDAEAGFASGITCDPATGEAIVPELTATPSEPAAAPQHQGPASASQPDGSSSLPWVVVGGLVLALAVIATAVALMLRRSRRQA